MGMAMEKGPHSWYYGVIPTPSCWYRRKYPTLLLSPTLFVSEGVKYAGGEKLRFPFSLNSYPPKPQYPTPCCGIFLFWSRKYGSFYGVLPGERTGV
eukprot:759509-Hanusia_phi.AAC.1